MKCTSGDMKPPRRTPSHLLEALDRLGKPQSTSDYGVGSSHNGFPEYVVF